MVVSCFRESLCAFYRYIAFTTMLFLYLGFVLFRGCLQYMFCFLHKLFLCTSYHLKKYCKRSLYTSIKVIISTDVKVWQSGDYCVKGLRTQHSLGALHGLCLVLFTGLTNIISLWPNSISRRSKSACEIVGRCYRCNSKINDPTQRLERRFLRFAHRHRVCIKHSPPNVRRTVFYTYLVPVCKSKESPLR